MDRLIPCPAKLRPKTPAVYKLERYRFPVPDFSNQRGPVFLSAQQVLSFGPAKRLIELSRLNWGRTESAGINRHRVEGVSPLHERRSCSIMAPSHASAIREEAAKR